METLLLELTLADAEVFARRADRARKEASGDASLKAAAEALARAAAHLDEGSPLRAIQWAEADLAAFRDSAPLTLKPAVWVVNVDEGDAVTLSLRAYLDDGAPLDPTRAAQSANADDETGAPLHGGMG